MNPDVNIYVAVNSYLVRCTLVTLISEEFGNVIVLNTSDSSDQLINTIEKTNGCLIIESDLFEKLNANILIPKFIDIIGISNNMESLNNNNLIKEWIYISDNKTSIIHKIKNVLNIENNNVNSTNLSDREKEVVRLVAKGFTNKEIAVKLNLSIHTIITHRKNITGKIGIKTISGLSIYALLNGIIQPDEAVI